MAWRSGGTTNDEMVDKMKRFEVISTPAIEMAFRQVDRQFFVPENQKALAHADQPLREGNLHISAPHIYGTVLEALDLLPNSSMSFLNLGSGTGYLSCIVASVLGVHSHHYGVDIHPEVVEHAKAAAQRWKKAKAETAGGVCPSLPHIEWIQGDALNIDFDRGEGSVGFDRIYVGSSVDKEDVPKIAYLLRPGGIMVGPVEDELVKIVRHGTPTLGATSTTKKQSLSTAGGSSTAMDTDEDSSHDALPSTEFTQHLLSGVRFASLVVQPSDQRQKKTVLPSMIWSPTRHHQYPDSFRNSCREILLCCQAPKQQPPRKPKSTFNAAGLLPRCLWMEILSYTRRDWFESPVSELEFLRRRLAEEQQTATRAQEARRRAEARCQQAEEERDVYRILARRYQLRLEAALQRGGASGGDGQDVADSDSDLNALEDDDDDDIDDVDEDNASRDELQVQGPIEVVPNQPVLSRSGFSLGAVLRSIRNEQHDIEEDQDDVSEAGRAGGLADINDGNRIGNSDDSMPDLDDTTAFSNVDMTDQSESFGFAPVSEAPRDIVTTTSVEAMSSGGSTMGSRQPRTVSIASESSL